MKISPEKAINLKQANTEKQEVVRSKPFEDLHRTLKANKEMFRLFGDEALTDKDLSRYVESNQKLVDGLPALIEKNLNDTDRDVGHEIAIAMIEYAPVESRESLILLGLKDEKVVNRVLAASMIQFVPEVAKDRISQEIGKVIKDGLTNLSTPDFLMIYRYPRMIRYMAESSRAEYIRLGLSFRNPNIMFEAAKQIKFAPEEEQDALRQELFDFLNKSFDVDDHLFIKEYTTIVSELPEEKRSPFIFKSFGANEWFVRRAAVDVVQFIPAENERLIIIEKAIRDPDLNVRKKSVDAVRYAPEKDRARLILELLEVENADIFSFELLPIDSVPQEDRGLIAKRLEKVIPELLTGSVGARLGRIYGVKMIKFAPEDKRSSFIEMAFDEGDSLVRQQAALAIPFVPESDRERLIREGLNDKNESVRVLSLLAIRSMSNQAKIDLLEKLKKEKKVDLNNIASATRLYNATESGFYKADFKKDGSRTTLLGRAPGHENEERLKNQIIARHIQELPYLNWEKAYESVDFWKSLGFDYVPVEPIVAVRSTDGKYDKDFWQETETKLQASARKNLGIFNVTVFSRVLNGPTVAKWIASFGPFQDEIMEQVVKIRRGLQDLGLNHGHTHLNNFVIMFPRLPDGTVDISKPPRVYIIDFDQAKSSDRLSV